jgi:hypothetical protein
MLLVFRGLGAGHAASITAMTKAWSPPAAMPSAYRWLMWWTVQWAVSQIPGSRGAARGLLTGSLGWLPPSRVAEYPGDGLPRPAHPFGREFRVLAELLRHPPGAAPAAELVHGHGYSLPDLPGAGFIGSSQRGHEQSVGPCRADAEVIHHSPHHTPPRRLDAPNYISGVRHFRFVRRPTGRMRPAAE